MDWREDAGTLLLRDASGAWHRFTADQIYRWALEGDHGPELPVGPVPSAIEFSRYPLNIRFVIEPEIAPEGEEKRLSLNAYATSESKNVRLHSISNGIPDHILIDRTWYPVERGAQDEARELLKKIELPDVGCIRLKHYLRLMKLAADGTPVTDASRGLAEVLSGSLPSLTMPKGFTAKLFEYQNSGFHWLHRIVDDEIGGILADEMGLGKTVQVAAIIAAEEQAGHRPSLVIAPMTLLENWRRELGKFVPDLRVQIHQGSNRTGFPSELASAPLTITSYDTLVRDVALFRQIRWRMVILDEAQAIKNPDAKRSKAVKQIPRDAAIAMTGTPVENRLMDLWSIMDFALPGFLGDRESFDSRYPQTNEGAAALEPVVSPVMLRRRVAEVAKDLPDRIDIPQVIELSDRGKGEYESIRLQVMAEYSNQATLVEIGRLRMYCTHPALSDQGSNDIILDSPKYERLIEILSEIGANREKAIIFTSFSKMIDLLESDLKHRFGCYVASIDGRTPVERRQEIVDEFSDQKGLAFLALNPRAAGTGLNITAANHVIHYNPEWNPAVQDQASARAFRRGQRRPVAVHHLYYADTVEEVMSERLSRKREMSETAVVGVDGSDESRADILAAIQRSPIVNRRLD
jgi:SNF2 family DNA or RNA helicase